MDVDIKEAIDRITQLSEPKLEDLSLAGDKPVVVTAESHKLHSVKKLLDEYATRPDRREGIDKLSDLESLVAWTNRHKDAGSVVFVDTARAAPKMTSIVDFDQAGEGDDKARFRRFRCLYEFPLDKRWQEWRRIDGQPMSQREFAEFIEDHVLDLIAPDVSADGEGNTIAPAPEVVSRFLALAGGRCAFPSEMVTLSRGLKVTVDSKVENRVTMQSGEGALLFQEEHKDSNGVKLDVPQVFLICIPVFDRAEDHYRIPVRLRYRIVSGKVVWLPTLFGADEVIDRAIEDATRRVAEATGLPVLNGWPAQQAR